MTKEEYAYELGKSYNDILKQETLMAIEKIQNYTDKDEVERLNNILEQIKEYIEYSLNNPFADERMTLEIVLAKIKIELKGDNK